MNKNFKVFGLETVRKYTNNSVPRQKNKKINKTKNKCL